MLNCPPERLLNATVDPFTELKYPDGQLTMPELLNVPPKKLLPTVAVAPELRLNVATCNTALLRLAVPPLGTVTLPEPPSVPPVNCTDVLDTGVLTFSVPPLTARAVSA